MKTLVVFFWVAFAVGGHAGFMPPIVDKGFTPIAEEWHGSLEELDDPENYDFNQHDFEDHPKTVHVHEDFGHHDYHHFENSHERHEPTIINYHEHPKTVHIIEKPEVHVVKESLPRTVHVHEHHHHHHHHVKTLPVSIIKKTVYIKHG